MAGLHRLEGSRYRESIEEGASPMSERQIVGMTIRIFGLWRILITGLSSLSYLVASHLQGSTEFPAINAGEVKSALVGLIFNIVVGIAVIVASPAIVRMIYGDPPAPQP